MSLYTPGPIPVGQDPTLANYLSIELANIAESINGKTDLAYGGLNLVGPAVTQQVGIVPTLYSPFNNQAPIVPDGVLVAAPTSSLTILTGGVYVILFVANLINLPVNGEFIFELFRDGVGTGFSFAVDPSNQTSQIFLVGSSLVDAVKGDFFQVFVSSDLDFRTLETQTSSFYTTRQGLTVD